jgi:hypothetical protein
LEEELEGDWKKGTCPLCRGNEDAKHILSSCPEAKKMENAIYE